jgi:site-specific recombinase XerD
LTKDRARICEVADLEGLRLYDLRHFFASMLVSAGHSLYEVEQAFGHNGLKVTYAHLTKASLQTAADSAAERILAASQ